MRASVDTQNEARKLSAALRRGAGVQGRWGEQTLRLVPGHVEVSADNRTFRTLVDQPASCAIPPLG